MKWFAYSRDYANKCMKTVDTVINAEQIESIKQALNKEVRV